MHYDEIRLKLAETIYSERLDPEKRIIIRLDGRRFKQFCRVHKIVQPYSYSFRDSFIETASAIMENTGFEVTVMYHHCDEMNFLLRRETTLADRNPAQLISIFASAAGAYFTTEERSPAIFEGTIHQCSNEDVVDYFLWRRNLCYINSLNRYVHYYMREDGLSPKEIEDQLRGKNEYDRRAILLRYGVTWGKVAETIRYGAILRWTMISKSVYTTANKYETRQTYTTLLDTKTAASSGFPFTFEKFLKTEIGTKRQNYLEEDGVYE